MQPEGRQQPDDDRIPVGADDDARDPLEVVLTEYTDEVRQGRTPSIEEFATRYPQLAEQIREFFPLISGLEQWKNDREMECLRRSVPVDLSIEKLGEYRIIRELGRGGMGVVFEAEHTVSQRIVAIKLLPWRFAANMPIWKERLQHEASTIAALQHPNIVPIYSFSEDQGYSYYVMQMIDGAGLDLTIEQLKQKRRGRRASKRRRVSEETSSSPLTHDSWRGFAKIGEQVALALAYAHDRGVTHNDIKPSNLLIRANRQVILTDFGIGLPQRDEVTETDERAIGTLKFMAPERLKGTGSSTSDVYSLGATLYELATQKPLFEFRKRSQLIDAILHRQPIAPRKLAPEIPVPFEKIILKSISKSPADRYSSARELAADLRRFINRQPIAALETGLWQRAISAFRDAALRWTRTSR